MGNNTACDSKIVQPLQQIKHANSKITSVYSHLFNFIEKGCVRIWGITKYSKNSGVLHIFVKSNIIMILM